MLLQTQVPHEDVKHGELPPQPRLRRLQGLGAGAWPSFFDSKLELRWGATQPGLELMCFLDVGEGSCKECFCKLEEVKRKHNKIEKEEQPEKENTIEGRNRRNNIQKEETKQGQMRTKKQTEHVSIQ